MPEREPSARDVAPLIPRRPKLARAVHVESFTLSRRKALMEHIEARRNIAEHEARVKSERPKRSA